jgi:CubicO group peptidase (beta-lactamase class C family)
MSACFVVALGLWVLAPAPMLMQGRPAAPAAYYPPPDQWEHKKPEDVGMDGVLLERAIAFARAHESTMPRDFSDQVQKFGRVLGPLPKERGGTNGLVIRHGYIVGEFGDTTRVDPTYSAAKSFLSTALGVALDRGLIKDVNDPVRNSVHDGGYDSPHNAKIAWHHHVQQTSEWEGVMWGKPHDFLGIEEFGAGKREPRTLQEPGTFYEYNDVRINRLALSLLRVFKKPLPDVLKEAVMDPIGASQTWKYLGYDNSDVVIDGKTMKSVNGGTRWGGGWWVNSRDQARYGYLFLREGQWKDRQILSEKWVRMATTPGPVGPDYGYLWWLNTQGKAWPHAPKSSFAARGHGSNMIWVDPEHDLVVVWRWHAGSGDEFLGMVIQAIKTTTTPHE